MNAWIVRSLVVGLALVNSARAAQSAPAGGDAVARLGQILQANIVATHAYQVTLAAKDAQADKNCFADAGLSDAQLQELIAHQKSLLTEKPEAVKAWVDGRASAFDPTKDLQPILDSVLNKAMAPNLPVNVLIAYFKEKSPQATDIQVRSLASLMQMMFDIDRDGDVLQNMYDLYQALGLRVYLGQVGIADVTDEQLLAIGNDLSPRMCLCPFETTAKAIQIHGRKMYNWGRRRTGERDVKVLAAELLKEDDVKAILPLVEKMPPQKIAVIGHSYTMGVHWATPSAFVPIVAEMLRSTNPKVEIRQWQAGGLTAERAYSREKFYEQVLAWKPDRVLLVLGGSNKANQDALNAMADGFTQEGIEVMMFDRLRLSRPRTTTASGPATASTAPAPVMPSTLQPLAPNQAKVHVIEVGPLLDASAQRAKFAALDGIHMAEPWHRLMAKEWLKYLCGARHEKLE